MRFLSEQHLRRQVDFRIVRASGIRREGGFFLCQLYCPASGNPPLRRVGVIASRRVGNAVIRNRCKRLLREVFRRNQALLPEHCDLVLVARRRMIHASYQEIESAFQHLIQKQLNKG